MVGPTLPCAPKILRRPRHCLADSEIAVMGPQGAAKIIFRHEEDVEAKTEEYIENFATPYYAAKHGMVEMVIEPKTTRPTLIKALRMLKSKQEDRPKKNTVIFLCDFDINHYLRKGKRGDIHDRESLAHCVINMTIVFGVLIILGILMKVIYWIDRQKKRKRSLRKLPSQ